jgi:hypothetical protein
MENRGLMRRVWVFLVCFACLLLGAQVAPQTDELHPTPWFVDFRGAESTLGGRLLPVGAVIRAYDPSGVLAGRAEVVVEGWYLMAVYGDDPQTALDEGAEPGDRITFTIDHHPATPLGPDAPVWTMAGGLPQVELGGGIGVGWVDFYSEHSVYRGEPVPVGAVVTAHDPQGVQCGAATVKQEGKYGVLSCTCDDPASAADEGPEPGEPISFRIDGVPVGAMPISNWYVPVPPSTPIVWTKNGDLWEVDLGAPPQGAVVGGYSIPSRGLPLPSQPVAVLTAAMVLTIILFASVGRNHCLRS